MKKRIFLRKRNLFKCSTFLTALLVSVALISSSSISVTINKISKTENIDIKIKEEEIPAAKKLSTGLAPNVAVFNNNKPTGSIPFGENMRGYIVNSTVYDEGTCYFDIEDPGDVIYYQDSESDDFLSGATGHRGRWIACENSSGALWDIDPEDGDMTYIGGGGIGLTGLAKDYTTDKMYGSSGSNLYLINPWDGSQEHIGSFGSEVNEMIGIATNAEGILYGWDLGDKLWVIDKETGETEEIGPLGIDLNFAQDGSYHYEDCTLYLTAFTVSPNYGSYLYVCDTETGECIMVDQFEGNSQITASVIYLGGFCTSNDVGVKEIISPKDGDAGEDIDVILQVKNYGNNSENNVKVNVVISKNGVDEEYNETVYVDVPWDETVDVEMPSWTPDDWQSVSNKYVNYTVAASVHLYGDDNPNNDYKEKLIELYFGYFHDVGCINLIGPETGPAQTFPVKVTIKNFGQYDECCFKTYVEISELDTEYEDYKCTTNIEPGQEIELVLNDWTPDFLKYETSGIKNYTMNVWTDMDDPPDENPDNDLFTKSIQLDFYHDVGIKGVVSPPPNVPGKYKNYWYAVDCFSDNFIYWCPETGEGGVIGPTGMENFPQGGTFVEDEWWICDTKGNIWIVDTETGNKIYIGNAGTGELTGLAYHEASGKLYGCSTSHFYKIDMETGEADYIGSLGCGGLMISIDCDRNGKMYGFDLNFGNSKLWSIDLDTGTATAIGNIGFSANYGQDMAYDYDNGRMYACVFDYNTWHGQLRKVNLETGKFSYLADLEHQLTCFAISYTFPFQVNRYVQLGTQDIDVIVENIGTFPELDLSCYAEIYEYITNCTNGFLVYDDNITGIDLDEPLGGNQTLNFNSYNFETEGFYGLFLDIQDDNDDYPNNNEISLGIGADDTPPVSNHTLDPESPDGENSWYVSDIEITICAIDPSIGCGHPGSGVKEIRVNINGDSWEVYEDDCITIIIDEEGDGVFVEYYSVDNVGNEESIKSFTIKRDSTPPDLDANWEVIRRNQKYYIKFTCEATDSLSGMNKIEIYIDDVLYETIEGPGPMYVFEIEWSSEYKNSTFKFIAYDMAGNSDFKEIEDVKNKSFTISKSITSKVKNVMSYKTSKLIKKCIT
jgi:hypothetical protein